MSSTEQFHITLKASELDRDEKQFSLSASEADCIAIAERLGLVSLAALTGDLKVRMKDHNEGVLVCGSVSATLVQRCIVSLADVPEKVEVDFELLLVDAETANRMDEDEVYLDDAAPEYDALEGDEIDLAEIVVQTLSINMDPYPRASDAAVTVASNPNVSVNEGPLEKPNPFSALSKLKDKS